MRDYDECRTYVEHIIAEHRRLHRMLRLARSAIIASGGPDRDATGTDVTRVLRQVREELAHHFAEEEEGGCLDEAVSHLGRQRQVHACLFEGDHHFVHGYVVARRQSATVNLVFRRLVPVGRNGADQAWARSACRKPTRLRSRR